MIRRVKTISLAWLILGLAVALIGAAAVMILADPGLEYSGWGIRGFPTAIAVPIVAVGFLILQRHPQHTVGWLLLVLGLASALQGFLFEYGLYALYRNPDSLPGGEFVAWFLNWVWIIIIWIGSLILVTIPTGQLPSPRWRPVIGLFSALAVSAVVITILVPGPLNSSFPSVDNPTGIETWDWFTRSLTEQIAASFLVGTMGIGALAPIIRYRRSQGIERQQLKWIAFAAFLIALAAPTAAAEQPVYQLLLIIAEFFLPVAIGIAILRYRLYDIDVIIRRSLVYGLLTILLVGVYFGTVVLLQTGFTAVTGQESPVAIVISTLIIAALFNPLRQRLQAFIDRRFFRRKYDASRTLAQFAKAARDEVSLEALTSELNRVVQETMQPEMTALWVKNVGESNSNE